MFIVLICVLGYGVSARAAEVEVQALFTHAAMLKIQGQSKMLKVGQSFAGVTLLAATSEVAVIEINGKRQEVVVSQRITGNYQTPTERRVRIPRDSQMQYQSQAEINGRRVKILVDTGANVVAMNSIQASSLNIDYQSGVPSRVTTAAGVVDAWMVTLDSVSVGGIRVNSVQASVIEGGHPTTILLGMTFLQHVEMHESDGILLLTRGY